jgi:hypothetical protein
MYILHVQYAKKVLQTVHKKLNPNPWRTKQIIYWCFDCKKGVTNCNSLLMSCSHIILSFCWCTIVCFLTCLQESFVHSIKLKWWGFVHSVKFSGGVLSTLWNVVVGFCPLYKILSGGVLTGGVLSYIPFDDIW